MAIGLAYQAICDAASECGVDVDAVLAAAGLSRGALADPATRLSPEEGGALGRELFRRSGDPAIGLRAAAHFRLTDLDLLGYLVQHSLSVLDALECFGRYCRLLGDTAECRVERGARRFEISLGRSGGRAYLLDGADMLVGIFVRLVRECFPDAPPPLEVRLPRPRPSDPAPYRRFFAAPVRFAAPVGAVAYPAAAASLTNAAADQRLGQLLRERAETALAALPPDGDLVDRLRAYLACHLGEAGDLRSVAARLRMSERTLRRRLRQSGTGYRALLDDVRRERAVAMLDAGGHNVTDVAAHVGFADVSAFARAFRRWTGKPPHHYAR